MKNGFFLINASNLHDGGGVQVATSFIYELSLMGHNLPSMHAIVSTEVANALSRLDTNMAVFGQYDVIDTYGLKAVYSKLNNRIKSYKVVFTIFGPNYLRVKSKNEIVGFAQLWILNFNNPVSEKMSFFSKNVLHLKFFIQWLFFLRADHYIVELEHVKRGLVENKGVNKQKISVVYNTVSSLYLDENKWKTIYIEKGKEKISLGIVTRDYPHKNLGVLPAVAQVLESEHNLKVHFYTTLNKDEWSARDEIFKKYVSTIGSLSPDQCPSFYEQVDGVVFPSLLECFSATPLEAMVMNKPLFASDRGFVRDVCSDHAIYFDPLDVDDIALSIAKYFESDINHSQSLQEARDHALNFSTAKGRAESYLKIIQKHLEG